MTGNITYWVLADSAGQVQSAGNFTEGSGTVPAGAELLTAAEFREFAATQTKLRIDGAWVDPPDGPAVVPSSVGIAAAQIVMHGTAGGQIGRTLLDDVEALVARSDDMTLKIAWAKATVVDRTGRFVSQLASQLGLTDAAVDALFVAAGKITL